MSCRNVSARHFLPSATHFLPSATHLLPSAAHLPSAKNWLLKHTSCAAESARNFVIPHSENGPGTFNCQSKTAFVGFNVSFESQANSELKRNSCRLASR